MLREFSPNCNIIATLLPETDPEALDLLSNPHGEAEAELPLGRRSCRPYQWEGTFPGALGEPWLGLWIVKTKI